MKPNVPHEQREHDFNKKHSINQNTSHKIIKSKHKQQEE